MNRIFKTIALCSLLMNTYCSSLGLKAPWSADSRGPSSDTELSAPQANTMAKTTPNIMERTPSSYRGATTDVHLGMSGDQAQNLWGSPVQKELAAGKNPRFQRWTFEKTVITSQGARTQTRYLYLENNRVIGWETR